MGNNNTNVTTTKGIARSLTNSTSPQSDSENRPIQVPSSIMNGAPKPGHAVSPAAGNQFKQSTIAFNNANKKSPAAAHGGVKMVGKDKSRFSTSRVHHLRIPLRVPRMKKFWRVSKTICL